MLTFGIHCLMILFKTLKNFSIISVVPFCHLFLMAIAIAIIYYESEAESLNVQMKAMSTFVCFQQQVGQLLLFHPKSAPEVISDCLKSKIFLGDGGGACPQIPLVETDY